MEILEVPVQPPPRIGNGATSSASEIDNSPCQCGDDSQSASTVESKMQLPEDILYHIHTLMPMQDAARAACASRCFLRSWRFYPRLNLNVNTLRIDKRAPSNDKLTIDFISRVDPIMLNHAGTGVKMFKLTTHPCFSLHPSYVDRWLQIAFAPGIKEFELEMTRVSKMDYDFPCSLLSRVASSIQSFLLGGCSFHPGIQIGQMSTLTSLRLRSVKITEEELCGFLSKSCALQRLLLSDCHNIVVLKIPHLLELNYLEVLHFRKLEVIDSSAPKLSTFIYAGPPIQISLGEALLQVKKMQMFCDGSPDALHYGSKKLPSIAPNIQKLYLSTRNETVNTPKVLGKFLQLKCLEILLLTPDLSPGYDFCSLVSFIDASPALETFILRIERPAKRHDSILEALSGDSMHPMRASEYRHDNLKNMMITGFSSAKSMIDLANHILEKASSLEYLTLDTTRGYDRRNDKIDPCQCLQMSKEALLEAEKALLAIRIYVEGRVPSSVSLKVIEPCSNCHTETRS
ncbi:uncharacterized protein [Oryza sativa Japonica Group]|uniref:At1g61320/AtMIF1 LRR domain-containing protein n=2 Tax=Oryza sativa subsp. japonica TaxID=39947 RepID=B9GAZ5_ORYSJ|nr:uncharacterized protein LOC9268504 isoform X1 [Oryza sativa Japonica Group]EEE52201.1 hypothetical protein OsJ_34087 [Oryza sativa Japonica Group]KAF2911076.1 hypothetical protein DAI22_11g150000 [Oryza sativa Japonica Group]